MKNTIIKYGLIAGGISATGQLITSLYLKSSGLSNASFDTSAYLGYTLITLAMAVIYFGIKAFRDGQNEGSITFSKALMLGLGIAAIACVCYSLMWTFVYYNLLPNFMDDYATFSIAKLKAEGASEAKLLENQAQIADIKRMYASPLGVFTITLIEPLPVGLLVAVVSAFILKRK